MILIKSSIEMPTTCGECFACHYQEYSGGRVPDDFKEGYFCYLTEDETDVEDHCWNGTKPDWCPLEEVANDDN